MADVLRLSQLITTYGPGSLLDLPTRSVMVGGLENWNVSSPKISKVLNEPRLQQLLERSLREAGRITAEQSVVLRTPPVDPDSLQFGTKPGIDAFVFPTMFVCDRTEDDAATQSRRRRIVRWEQLDPGTAKRKYRLADETLTDVSPIRFVAACEHGHIEDIDWRWVLHGDKACDQPRYLEERGTSGAAADTSIVCDCGARIDFQQASVPGRLGNCHGRRPWLGRDNSEACDKILKLLTRTATNTYFPQSVGVISLPLASEDLAGAIEGVWDTLKNVRDLDALKTLREHVPAVRHALQGHDIEACFAQISAKRDADSADRSSNPRAAEFDLLASGRTVIGDASRESRLYAMTLPRDSWNHSSTLDLSFIKSIVAVHRLREVSCLYGFTRFESAPTLDDELDEIALAVSGAPLGQSFDWLPAIEQFGEGVFLQFDSDVIEAWLEKGAVKKRKTQLLGGFKSWQEEGGRNPKFKFPGIPYVLLHTLAHALMLEVALESGYPASSVKERIYAIREGAGAGSQHRLGLLIYTASTGAQGTLGGLVGTASNVPAIIERALERLRICSNDPICADHEPVNPNGDRNLHGAACHGCVLVAETSCEKRNEYLDRALLVETMAANGASLFG
jgi:hypothetical protein